MITLTINNNMITTDPQMNDLGVIFDSKLQWNEQFSKRSKEANFSSPSHKDNQTTLQCQGTSNTSNCKYLFNTVLQLRNLTQSNS